MELSNLFSSGSRNRKRSLSYSTSFNNGKDVLSVARAWVKSDTGVDTDILSFLPLKIEKLVGRHGMAIL